MKTSTVTSLAAVAALASTAAAYPGMGRVLAELQRRQQQSPGGFPGSTQLLGDLVDLPDSSLTAAGAAIKGILSGSSAAQALGDGGTVYTAPGPLDSPACAADKCCVYKYAVLDMAQAFADPATGQCNSLARQAIRLGFHDAGAWETDMGYGSGGADGSVILSPAEMARTDNVGLQNISWMMTQWYAQYHPHGAGMADLVQLAAMAAVVTCPQGPRIRFFAGRTDNSNPAATGMLPQPTQSADALIDLFGRKSFSPAGLAVLVGAHTVSQQFSYMPAAAGAAQDATPGVWDNNFYSTVVSAPATAAPVPGASLLTLPSDLALAQHAGTADSFSFFATQAGRAVWQQAFAAEYLRVSVLGVYNINDLIDCTNIMPLSTFSA